MKLAKSIGFIFLICLLSNAFVLADQFHLKNGNVMDGTLSKETDSEYVVDIGFGVIHLPKSDVIKIDKKKFTPSQANQAPVANQAKTDKAFQASPDRMPTSDREWRLYNLLKKLERTKGTVKRYAQRRDIASRDIDKIKDEIKKLENKKSKVQIKYLAKNLKALKYNDLVRKSNAYTAKINVKNNEIKKANANIEKYQGKIQDYQNSVAELDNTFAVIKNSSPKERQTFISDMSGRIDKLRDRIVKKEISSLIKDNRRVIVEVLLNGRIKANMLVDTGATDIRIAKYIATELGITDDKVTGEGYSTVADGRKVPVKSFNLDSVSVDGFEVKNVTAHFGTDDVANYDDDGLLGMSYLRHFDFKVDAANGKLILRKFTSRYEK